MALIRPRLTDHFGIPLAQAETDFAIPFLDEDLPLYVDPFLLWNSPSQQDQSLHTSVVNAFNHLGHLVKKGQIEKATDTLIKLSECDEVGLGLSRKRIGKRISEKTAHEILQLFKEVPEYDGRGFIHFEEIQFFVENISKDRVSDFSCSFLKSFLVDYTIQECKRLGIPQSLTDLEIYQYQKNDFVREKPVPLPLNPVDQKPVLLVPKRWLRFTPWLDFDDYFAHHCIQNDPPTTGAGKSRVAVLSFNRQNYGMVREYIAAKERTRAECHNDPLFSQIPVTSAKRTFAAMQKLQTGTDSGAAKKYEEECSKLLASLLYPQLDFAKEQSRTDSGVQIRDLIFYNNRSHPFLADIFDIYESRQIVFELKNVREVEGEHINQLNRYLKEEFGRFGVLVTRNQLPKTVFRNTLDLWAGHRKSIIALSDADIELMVDIYESKQRDPVDVIKRSYADFSRSCPS